MKLMYSLVMLFALSLVVVSNNKASAKDEKKYYKRMKRMQELQREQDAEKVAINRDEKLLHACQDMENPATCVEVVSAVLRCKSVTQQRLQTIEKYLKAGAQPNRAFITVTRSGRSPFHWAVGNNSPELVSLLLKNGADVAKPIENISGYGDPLTPLGMAAVNYDKISSGEFSTTSLRSKKAIPVCYAISWRDNLTIGNMLLEYGAKRQNGVEKMYASGILNNTHVFRDPHPFQVIAVPASGF